jgi:hypothetical protein
VDGGATLVDLGPFSEVTAMHTPLSLILWEYIEIASTWKQLGTTKQIGENVDFEPRAGRRYFWLPAWCKPSSCNNEPDKLVQYEKYRDRPLTLFEIERMKPMWLLWFQNQNDKKYSSFNAWASDADEAIDNVAREFFDSQLLCITLPDENDMHQKVTSEKDEDITFPKQFMKLLLIQRFVNGDLEGIAKAREKTSLKFINKKD